MCGCGMTLIWISSTCELVKIGTLGGPVSSSVLSSPARIGGCRFDPWCEAHFYHLSSLARSYFFSLFYHDSIVGSRNMFPAVAVISESAEMSKFLLISSFV